MADTNGVAVEANRSHAMRARRIVGADQRLAELGAIASEPAGERNVLPRDAGDAGNQLAAVEVEPARQHKKAGKPIAHQRPADSTAAGARISGASHGLMH